MPGNDGRRRRRRSSAPTSPRGRGTRPTRSGGWPDPRRRRPRRPSASRWRRLRGAPSRGRPPGAPRSPSPPRRLCDQPPGEQPEVAREGVEVVGTVGVDEPRVGGCGRPVAETGHVGPSPSRGMAHPPRPGIGSHLRRGGSPACTSQPRRTDCGPPGAGCPRCTGTCGPGARPTSPRGTRPARARGRRERGRRGLRPGPHHRRARRASRRRPRPGGRLRPRDGRASGGALRGSRRRAFAVDDAERLCLPPAPRTS